MRRFVGVMMTLLLVWAVAIPAHAAATLTISSPAENAHVKGPVRVAFTLTPGTSFATRVEVAHGAGATDGFQEVAWAAVTGTPQPGGGPQIEWDPAGSSGGPYTVRITALNPDTKAVLAQATRTFILDAPDVSPVVLLDPVPGVSSGAVTVTGRAGDTDLARWQLDAVDALGTVHSAGAGTSPGEVKVAWDASLLPDGPYTLRLTAWDQMGNSKAATVQTEVKNPRPAVQTAVFETEPAIARVPVTYTSVSAVTLTLKVGEVTATGTGEAGARVQGFVPIDLTRVAAGDYTAHLHIADAQGRTDDAAFTVRVLPVMPRPVLQELPVVSGPRVDLQWRLPEGIVAEAVEVVRSGPDGAVTLAVPAVTDTALSDTPPTQGAYTYTVAMKATDGRRIESMGRQTLVDTEAPALGQISVSPIDGVGLNLRWATAEDRIGLAGYEVLLLEGDQRTRLTELLPGATSFSAPLPEGSYQVILAAIDRAGNRTESRPLPFRVQSGAVTLMLKGRFLPADVPGFIEDGRTWVPLRLFGEALGYEVHWNGAKQMASLLDKTRTRLVYVTVGEAKLQAYEKTNERVIDLPGVPRNIDGRVVVPLRALLEALGASVKWHQDTRTVELLID